jgi:hypothetical protein
MRGANLMSLGGVLPQLKDAPSLAGSAGKGATIPPPDERRSYS